MTHFLAPTRRVLVGFGLLAAVAIGLVAALNPHPARAATPTCSASQLVETINSSPGGASAGTDYDQLKFTNLGGTCELRGYPGVSAVNLDGKQMGKPAVRQSGSEKEVTLKAASSYAAASAYETIGFVNTSALSGCDQKLAAGLRIYAPGSTVAKYVPFVVDACSTDTHTFMEIKPIS